MARGSVALLGAAIALAAVAMLALSVAVRPVGLEEQVTA